MKNIYITAPPFDITVTHSLLRPSSLTVPIPFVNQKKYICSNFFFGRSIIVTNTMSHKALFVVVFISQITLYILSSPPPSTHPLQRTITLYHPPKRFTCVQNRLPWPVVLDGRIGSLKASFFGVDLCRCEMLLLWQLPSCRSVILLGICWLFTGKRSDIIFSVILWILQ